jgi:hypothetical protein
MFVLLTLVLQIQRCVAVDVMIDGCAPPNSPVDTWTYRELMAWLSHTDGGKFSQLVLPANMSGQDLLNVSVPIFLHIDIMHMCNSSFTF